MTTEPTTVDDEDRVLHVIGSPYGGYYLVSAATLEAATEAQAEADAAPYYENFGDLRRSGDSALLADHLEAFDLSLESYAEAIERSAGRTPASPDIGQRLAALNDVEFDGDDDANAPADADEFRSEHELDNEVEDHFNQTLSSGMCDDVPEDVLNAFDASQNLMFVDYSSASVDEDRLEKMIAVLEARGYTIVRE